MKRIMVDPGYGSPIEVERSDVPPHAGGAVLLQLPHAEALTHRSTIERLLGAVDEVHQHQLSTDGYSGSVHQRVEVLLRSGRQVNLVVKQVNLALDWTAYRTGDGDGREARLLAEPALDGLWNIFHCPYLALATNAGNEGLLMEDLAPHLFPDEDAPISVEAEGYLLGCLARMHARYWESEVLDLPWLTPPASRFGVMGPPAASEDGWRAPVPPIFDLIRRGWRIAAKRLSPDEMQFLRQPANVLSEVCAGLPWTLLHGDAKMAHFALIPGSRVAALDWELMGVGPATLDLGWYLAVNSERLARSKEEVINCYRELLEAALGNNFAPSVWARMMYAGLLCGAVMLLWAKALALESGQPEAEAEWEWWVGLLKEWA